MWKGTKVRIQKLPMKQHTDCLVQNANFEIPIYHAFSFANISIAIEKGFVKKKLEDYVEMFSYLYLEFWVRLM